MVARRTDTGEQLAPEHCRYVAGHVDLKTAWTHPDHVKGAAHSKYYFKDVASANERVSSSEVIQISFDAGTTTVPARTTRTVEQCKAECLADPNCVSFDYKSGTCVLSETCRSNQQAREVVVVQ